ncbi:MAG: Coenzyme F420 hydrogenase/dehydrogenase, beta subunit C-terminal domain, partial [Endomicrobiaceae bacterium]|nr:Coenzyme F420 hydrogenase/dehydrogenase, beta subunit C-terminal domain [Endomicrobiaceae bacterium]
PFYSLFFSDFLLNDACYFCKTKSSFDFADIRLGDFWGSAFNNREDGISAISVFTNVGKNILDKLKTDRKIILLPKEHDICIKNQSSLKKSCFNHPYKEKQLLMNLLKNKIDMSKILKEYFKILSLKKRIFLIIKKLIPNYSMVKFRKFYHYYKEN